MIIEVEVKSLSPVYYVEDIEKLKLSMIVYSHQLNRFIGGNMYASDSESGKEDLEAIEIGDLLEVFVSETKGGNTFRILDFIRKEEQKTDKIVNDIEDPF